MATYKNNIFFLYVCIVIHIGCSINDSSNGKKVLKHNVINIDKSEILNTSFKEFLKEKGIDMDINVKNKYETLLPNNLYSNHYYNVTTNFPDYWEHDRGVAENTIFRAFEKDSGLSIILNVIPLKLNDQQKEMVLFQKSF